MAKSFLKTKGAFKTAPQKLGKAGLRVAGATGAGYLSNKVIGDKIDKKYHGLILMAAGLAGEVFIDNEYAAAVAQGVTTMGGLQTLGKLVIPEQAANIGLAGDEDFSSYEVLNGDDDTPGEYETPVEGVEDAMELLNGYAEEQDLMAGEYTPQEMELINSMD